MKNNLFFILGVLIGCGLEFVYTPLPKLTGDCKTYSVSKKVETAYVLKPPEQKPLAPVVVKEKCEQAKSNEPIVDAKPIEEDKPRKRHRRYRRYLR